MRCSTPCCLKKSLESKIWSGTKDPEKESKPKLPVAPAHFIQNRPFLRRWRFEDYLQQDLKHGIVLAHCMRGAGLELCPIGSESVALFHFDPFSLRTQPFVPSDLRCGCRGVVYLGWPWWSSHSGGASSWSFEASLFIVFRCFSIVFFNFTTS